MNFSCTTILTTTKSKRLNTQLDQYVINKYDALSNQDINLRQTVLTQIHNHISAFLKIKTIQLCPFGSFRLNIADKNSDIDTLLIIYSDDTNLKEQIFVKLVDHLKKLSVVTSIKSIPSAFVPILKLIWNNIDIDITVCQLRECWWKDNITYLNPTNHQYLENLTNSDIISLNGYRVTETILNTIPNKKTFQTCLKFIRMWAKARHIYSNIMGYFGGINCALLVAKICQLFPNLNSLDTITQFFKLYTLWKYPTPISINNIDEYYPKCDSWNIKQIFGNYFILLTPCYPYMNSTHKICWSTLNVIMDEFRRGCQLLKNGGELFETLLEEYNIEKEFKDFIFVYFGSDVNWVEFCKTQIIQLIKTLESPIVRLRNDIKLSFNGKEYYLKIGYVFLKPNAIDCEHYDFFNISLVRFKIMLEYKCEKMGIKFKKLKLSIPNSNTKKRKRNGENKKNNKKKVKFLLNI